MADDKNKKIVNTEEQVRAINPEDKNYSTDDSLPGSTQSTSNTGEKENPDGALEVERPHRIEGDDAGSIERRIPNM